LHHLGAFAKGNAQIWSISGDLILPAFLNI
jgi:hypothetical protein